MPDREQLAEQFLAKTPWVGAGRSPLAGDASNRRYDRLKDPNSGNSAIFMDAPPDRGENVKPFVNIARHLREQGLSAPEILFEDHENGFLILEDLGDAVFARLIDSQPELESELYAAATDVLVSLHKAPLPHLDVWGPRFMSEMVAVAFTHYRDGILSDPDQTLLDRFLNRFEDVLRTAIHGEPVMILRDYHAENLIWLPERTGIARVGLLDFQDAAIGHRAYDLVSLLQDVRRDVPAGIEVAMISRYIRQTSVDEHAFRTSYAVLGLQRNLRIMGVFARLGKDLGKPHYVDLIPRVWAHVMRDLEHPALAFVADLLREALPPPSPENLKRLKAA